MPMPIGDSDEAILLDIFGVFKTITITGIFEGTKAEQRTFISAIEDIENGTQVSAKFISSFIISPEDYKVFIKSFRWDKSFADINKLNYTLTLFEGAPVT